MTKGIVLLLIIFIVFPKIAATLSITYSLNLAFLAVDLRAMDFRKNTDLVFKAIINVVEI